MLLVESASCFTVMVEEETLAVEIFEVFSFNISHHLRYVFFTVVKEHFPVAQMADRPLRISVHAKNRHHSVIDHTGSALIHIFSGRVLR